MMTITNLFYFLFNLTRTLMLVALPFGLILYAVLLAVVVSWLVYTEIFQYLLDG